jgi:hypothetical protein
MSMGSSPTWLLFVLILNFGVSWANAISCGRAWEESKAVGGTLRLLVWSGAINSAIGFSSVMMFPLTMMAHNLWPDILTNQDTRAIFDLWYLTIIFPALGTGFIIMIESWNAAYRTRSLSNMSRATYNTLVQTHNTMRSVDNFGSAFKSVGSLFSGKGDARGKAILLMVVIVVLALCAGAILTATLIHRYAGTVDLPKSIHLTAAGLP